MRVTATHVYPVTPHNGLVAFANVVLDGALNLCGIGVYERMDGTGYRLTYPLKGKSYAFHPLTPALSKAIEQAVCEKVKTVIGNHHAGYYRPHDTSR